VFEASLPGSGPALLNDIVVENDNSLIVTDTLGNAIYRLNLESRDFTVVAEDIAGANGVAIDAEKRLLYVAGIGAGFAGGNIYQIALNGSGAARKWPEPFGLLDGIVLLPNGDILVSDWVAANRPSDGRLMQYAVDGTFVRMIPLPEGSHGPADIFYDRSDNRLWVPLMTDNSVIAIDLGD
jgi:sugar lactone lactonase YvrE